MFGYVTVAKNQLTEEEYEVFCSYYCGVCHSIGKKASQLSRMGLSYDITFLALVLSSVCSEDMQFDEKSCLQHPFKKRKFIDGDVAVDYAAQVGVLLDYLKLEDDLHDDKSIKAALGMLIFRHGYKKAGKDCEKSLDKIRFQLGELSKLENENCGNIDLVADCFAKILEFLFVPDFVEEKQKRALAWLGYNLGRWIYIIDAFNDIKKDKKKGSYNPFIASGACDKEGFAASIEMSLTLTLSNIASSFELIDFKINKMIIGKMVYNSLRAKQKSILENENELKGNINGSIQSTRRK